MPRTLHPSADSTRSSAPRSLPTRRSSRCHRELTASVHGASEPADLLQQSAQITLTDLPGLARAARRLAAQWDEQSLLNPDAAEATLGELAAELERIEPRILT